MNQKKWIYVLMTLCCVTVVFWLTGLVMAFQQTGSAVQVAEAPVTTTEVNAQAVAVSANAAAIKDGQLRVVALGDSLTKGTGDATGGGYVGYVEKQLEAGFQKKNIPVMMNNFGINGYVSAQLLELLDQPKVQAELKVADLILMSIGGNDLFKGGKTLANQNQQEVDQIQQDFQKQLLAIVQKIRKMNPESPLLMIGLYNPFGQSKEEDWTNQVVRHWNMVTADTLSVDKHTVLVPTYDLFQLETKLYLHSDQFHPNAVGYMRMAQRVMEAMPTHLEGTSIVPSVPNNAPGGQKE